ASLELALAREAAAPPKPPRCGPRLRPPRIAELRGRGSIHGSDRRQNTAIDGRCLRGESRSFAEQTQHREVGRSSLGSFHTQEVAGSKPAAPIEGQARSLFRALRESDACIEGCCVSSNAETLPP